MTKAKVDNRTTAERSADSDLLSRVGDGDERALEALIDRHSGTMLAVARAYVDRPGVAEEIVQDAWITVFSGLSGFRGRSSVRTWIVGIVVDQALARGGQLNLERAHMPAVDPRRFRSPDQPFPGHWRRYPADWRQLSDHALRAGAAVDATRAAIDELPPAERVVVTLRDLKGWSVDEVCTALELSTDDQRALLHAGRSRVREALERLLDA